MSTKSRMRPWLWVGITFLGVCFIAILAINFMQPNNQKPASNAGGTISKDPVTPEDENRSSIENTQKPNNITSLSTSTTKIGVYRLPYNMTLKAIATRFKCSVSELINLNPKLNGKTTTYVIRKGRYIRVPVKKAPTPPVTVTPVPPAEPPVQTAPPEPPVQTAPPEPPSALSSFQQKVVDLTNQERSKVGLKPLLSTDSNLNKCATEKSNDMYTKNYFDHNSPTYGSPFDMMKLFGVTYRYAGENIAKGQQTPEEVVKAWMNSSGHRANILNSSFTHIGVGYVNGKNQYIWTQQFIGK